MIAQFVHPLIRDGSKPTRNGSFIPMGLLLPIVLTCAQANAVIQRIQLYEMPRKTRNDLVWEIKQVAPSNCRFRDANAD